MLKSAISIPFALLLAGCAVVAVRDASQQYQQSLVAYKACLGANAVNPRACEAQRLVLEADERAYTNRVAATFGDNSTRNVNIQSR